MKILIIGSKGFIGNAAVNFYQEKKYSVFGCDIVNDYNSDNYFQIDATNSDFHQIFKSYDFDVCINCWELQVSHSHCNILYVILR